MVECVAAVLMYLVDETRQFARRGKDLDRSHLVVCAVLVLQDFGEIDRDTCSKGVFKRLGHVRLVDGWLNE